MNVRRILLYILGMAVLACGLMLNTKSTLGVSPIISVANFFSVYLGVAFGNATLIWYSIFILVEIIIHFALKGGDMKSRIVLDLLQFPVSIVFTRFLNVLEDYIPTFETDCAGCFAGSLPGRFLILLLALVLTGIGAALSLDMRIVPNPGDGIVQALADFFHRPVGDMKNFFDIGCVTTTLVCCFCLANQLIGIGIGTILAAILVGRVIFVFNKIFLDKMESVLL